MENKADYLEYIGLGVAGNFTGHLEQAGEASDFKDVVVKESKAPKGIFPFYVPSKTGRFIEVYPLSCNTIHKPKNAVNLQPEPEVVLICDLQYSDNLSVESITPKYFAAYNDCSIRKPNIHKISEKKNWGPNSKGISDQTISIDKFEVGGIMDQYRISCFLQRKDQIFEYGIDSPLSGYSYFHQKLLNWSLDQLNHQIDQGPLENISELLKDADYPSQLLISIGATQYSDFGSKNFLESGDIVYVIVYNQKDLKDPLQLIKNPSEVQGNHSVLKQIVS
ncbi:DUF5718 family protein [bacterium]|nr:DUF5718 family protein [bacterium]